ncbi:hypothetical protein VP03_05235 [Sinorhizobium meliloti]|nr:hypothetical protein VP03_05235 [Sinorhizobium meliloti]
MRGEVPFDMRNVGRIYRSRSIETKSHFGRQDMEQLLTAHCRRINLRPSFRTKENSPWLQPSI